MNHLAHTSSTWRIRTALLLLGGSLMLGWPCASYATESHPSAGGIVSPRIPAQISMAPVSSVDTWALGSTLKMYVGQMFPLCVDPNVAGHMWNIAVNDTRILEAKSLSTSCQMVHVLQPGTTDIVLTTQGLTHNSPYQYIYYHVQVLPPTTHAQP